MTKKEMKHNIWRLAWPAILQMSFQTSVGVITMILIGNFLTGAESVAAIGLSQRIMFLVIGTLVALTVGTTALVAYNFGAGTKEEAGIILSHSLIIGVGIALVLGICLDQFGSFFLTLLMLGNPDQGVISMGSGYLSVVGYSMTLGIILMIINAALQGAGDMKRPMYFTIGMNIMTIILGLILIPGFSFIPSLGLKGAALAEGISRGLTSIIAFIMLVRGHLVIKLPAKKNFVWRPGIVKDVLRIGLPSAGEQFVNHSSHIIYTILIATLGTTAIAANQVIMTVHSISFMPGFGFGVAATTLVGQSLGARHSDHAEGYGIQTSKMSAIFMGIMGVVFYIWARPLVQIFVPDPEVVGLAAECLRIVAFAQVPMSIVMVLSGGLRGAGDTRWVMYITMIGQWGIRLGLSAFAIWYGYGLAGVWMAMMLDMVIRCVLFLFRFRSGQWKTILRKAKPSLTHQSAKPRGEFS
ncbi:MAG: MATE family efflux transporter [Bacillota bacterium]